MRNLAAVVLFAIGLTATTVAAAVAASEPVTQSEWRAALADVVAHGRFSASHSCAAVVVARTHAPPTYREGSTVVHLLDQFLYTRCRRFGNLALIRVGMTDRQVVNVAGAPVPWLSGPRCWFYRTHRPGTAIDGMGFCFSAGRVDAIQTAVHA